MKIYNKQARHKYHILETLEAGIALTGLEVKAIRANRVDLSESFARINSDEVWLKNLHIFLPQSNNLIAPDNRRDRKLLLHRTQISTLLGKISQKAVSLIPISIYTTRNMIKVELALVASKKKYDHRKAIKARDEQRKIEQDLRSDKLNSQEDSRR